MKYQYHGQVLDHDFLDAEESDFWNWKMAGTAWYGQHALVGPTGLVYFLDNYDLDEQGMRNALESIIYGDDEAPYVSGLNPDDGDTGEDVDVNIRGHVKDDNWGVDEDTITVEVTVPGRGDVPGNLTITGNMLDFTYTFNPYDDLPYDTEVTVKVNASDLAEPPNAMPEFTYSFTTEGEPGSTVTPASLGVIKATYPK